MTSVFALVGCVDLTKPANVQTCAANGNCTDDAGKTPPADGKDATKDSQAGNDDGSRADAGREAGLESPDLAPDGTVPDVAAPDARDATAAEVTDGMVGVAPDKAPLAEPGPEPVGAEPSVLPEPGPEPTAAPEPGPEPGREPGPEPGPEPTPEPPADGGPAGSCSAPRTVTGGNVAIGSTAAFCFVTCDTIQYGWGCSSFTEADRKVTVNGVSVKCGGTLPAKTAGGYYYFEVGPGGHTWDGIWYSGSAATSCPTPDGGFTP